MNIIQKFLTKNDCYKTNRKITVKGLMIHSVGCEQPKAEVFINGYNKPNLQKCVHAFIDGNTGIVYQTLPWNHRAWHCGASGNNTHIGIEMCEPSTIKYTKGSQFTDLNPTKTKEVVLRTYNAAVELFAFLCEEYGLDPMKDITGHKEGCKNGIASNHGDPDHLWEHCGLSMNGFRKAVQAQMKKNGVSTSTKTEKPVSGQNSASYKVNVIKTVDVYSAPAVSQIKDKGVYTIVEEKNGYGKLKSGVGWMY